MKYRPIFLHPDWLHVRHLGWTDAWPAPGLRVMSRSDGPIMRHLFVSELTAGHRTLDGEIARRCSPFSEITIHDLTGTSEIEGLLLKDGFSILAGERMLNNSTLVIDLTQPQEKLQSAMKPDTRRKLRLAEKLGVRFDAECGKDAKRRGCFLMAYNAMAKQRGLSRMSDRALGDLLEGGKSRLAGAFADDCEAACFVLTYEAGKTAIFHHGASVGPSDPLLGRMVHWRLICQLAQEGFKWYDFGGLPSLDPGNGITRFKLGFGGTVIDLGKEYRRSGMVVRLARGVRHLAKR